MNKQAFLQGFLERWMSLAKQARVYPPRPPVNREAEDKKQENLRQTAGKAEELEGEGLERILDVHPGNLQPTTTGRWRP